MSLIDLSVALLHEDMVDKTGRVVTTALTLIDIHDIARSSRTYGLTSAFVAHPSPTLRRLGRTLKSHWEEGFGASYNPDRSAALAGVQLVADLDEAIHQIDLRRGALPKLIATSAKGGPDRCSYSELRRQLADGSPYLLMLGTGWGMSEPLLQRADCFLDPIEGCGTYNHLSVRSACAVMLDRLLGR